MKRFLGLFLMLFVFAFGAVAAPSQLQPIQGFHKKVYDSTFALYASSALTGVQNRFICTVTAYKKVKDGYLLIGAGHCTSANAEALPPDMTYGVAEDLGQHIAPIILLKSKMQEPLDYAIYFFPTKHKYPVMPLGTETAARIGDKTVDVNFSLGATKMVSTGVISSTVISYVNPMEDVHGFFMVTQFDSHGASGSSVISEKTHKVIGLVIAGWDGATMPSLVEPISSVEKEMQDVDDLLLIARYAPKTAAPVIPAPVASPDDQQNEMNWPALFQKGHPGRDHNGSRNGDTHSRDTHGDARSLDRNTHHAIDRRHDVREMHGHQEVFFGGFWFSCGYYGWPAWVFTDDVYVEMVGPNVYVIYSYNNPTRQTEIFIEE